MKLIKLETKRRLEINWAELFVQYLILPDLVLQNVHDRLKMNTIRYKNLYLSKCEL